MPAIQIRRSAAKLAAAIVAEYLRRELGSPCPVREWGTNQRWLARTFARLIDPAARRDLRESTSSTSDLRCDPRGRPGPGRACPPQGVT